MNSARDADRNALLDLDKERLFEFVLHQIRNIWRVDGLYFLGIEKRFGVDAATEVDAECWRAMAGLEARALKELLGLGGGLADLGRALSMTSWALDHADKELETSEDRVVFRVLHCRTQTTRLGKGLPEFPCKPVRRGYLEAFARAFACEATCVACPPDPHTGPVWCEWSFTRP